MSFSFGSSNPSGTGGFSFGSTPAPAGTAAGTNEKGASGGFSFGGTTSAAPASGAGFTFGATSGGSQNKSSTTTTPATSGVSAGAAPPAFGAPAPSTSSTDTKAPAAFSFGGSTAQSQGDKKEASGSTPGFGLATTAPAASTIDSAGKKGGFSFGGATATAPTENKNTPASGGFSFGGAPTVSGTEAKPPASSSAKDSKSSSSATGGFSFGAASGKGTNEQASTAPAAGGSFSFGKTETKNDPKIATAAEAPAAGGFSFGGAASTSTENSAPPAASTEKGGFSFAGAATTPNAPKTATNATTPATPAPVETPKPNTSITTTSAASETTASTTSVATVVDPPKIAYQTMTVEQILNKFQGELERDAVEHLKESRRVAQYDAILRDSQRSLSALTQKTSTLLSKQSELEGMLNSIGTFHTEFEKNLDQLEGQVDQLFEVQAHLSPSDADLQRENAYATAVRCNQRLESLTENVSGTLQQLEISGDGETSDILRILHQHQMQLVQLEQASRSIDHDINQLSNALSN